MKSKTLAIFTIVALCLSLASVLAPPLVSPAQASPMQTFHENIGPPTFIQNSNVRPITLQPGDEIIQFTRPNLVVGTNPRANFFTVGRVSQVNTGDLIGISTGDMNTMLVTWDELPPGTWKGYSIDTGTFDDGHGNTFSTITVSDLDMTGGLYPSSSGYTVATSGTGTFSGQVAMGTVSGDTNGWATVTARLYSSSEVSGPYAMSGTGTSVLGNVRDLGTSTGLNPNDEFVQVSRANIIIPKSDPVAYIEGGSSSASITSGILTGTITQTYNHISIPGTTPPYQGLTIAKVTGSNASGTISGVGIYDYLGISSGSGSSYGYMLALRENGTGAYANKDFYGTVTITDTGGTWTSNGNMYILGQPGVEVPASTGTGTAGFSPAAGTVQNLTAVPESSLPAEGKPNLQFPHGFFEFQITGLTPGETVGMTITLPSAAPVGTQYWKYGPTPGDNNPHWYQIPMGDDDGDNVITITLVDGGLGDDDLTANGVIVDQGGPGNPPSGGGGAMGVPVFPDIYIGIAAVLGAGVLAYFVRKRLIYQR